MIDALRQVYAYAEHEPMLAVGGAAALGMVLLHMKRRAKQVLLAAGLGVASVYGVHSVTTQKTAQTSPPHAQPAFSAPVADPSWARFWQSLSSRQMPEVMAGLPEMDAPVLDGLDETTLPAVLSRAHHATFRGWGSLGLGAPGLSFYRLPEPTPHSRARIVVRRPLDTPEE